MDILLDFLQIIPQRPVKIFIFLQFLKRCIIYFSLSYEPFVHEFFKLEQLILCEASHVESEKLHEEINRNTEEFIESLGIPYRQVVICGGDLKKAHVKSYDTELWVPLENTYREIASASYYHDFQTRRFNTRYDDNGTKRYVHSLNATAIPTPRILVSLVENYQQEDGSVVIPEALRPYMGKDKIVKKS